MDVLDRYSQLRARLPTLNLYALVDGALYQQHQERQLEHVPGVVTALFSGTPDDALAHAGPWLVDAMQATDAVLGDLTSLETTIPAVTWVIAEADLRHDFAAQIGLQSTPHIVKLLYLCADAPPLAFDREIRTYLLKPDATPEHRLDDLCAVVMILLKEKH